MQPKLDPTRKVIKYFDLKKTLYIYRFEYYAADTFLNTVLRSKHLSIIEARLLW